MADYVNLIYFRDAKGLYINLFVPSEVSWTQGGQQVKLTQETEYPVKGESRVRITAAIRFRVPDWATEMSVEVSGEPMKMAVRPSSWAAIERRWRNGDRMTV